MSPDRNNFERVERVLHLPIEVAKGSLTLGRAMLQQTLDVLVPPQSTELGEQLAEEHPLTEAEIGVRTIEYGEKKGDPEVVFHGEAILAKAVVKAADDENIPDEVTGKIVEIVVEKGIEIELAPLLTDETIKRVEEITEDFQN